MTKDEERYRQLLAESRKIQGSSLWADARRQLRRNRPVMISLTFLVGIGIAALLAPLLPLQSPIVQDLRDRQFQPPNLTPQTHELSQLPQEVAEFRQQIAAVRAEGGPDAAERLKRLFADHPYNRYWHYPGASTRVLIACRIYLFGDYCIPSLCGTDALGRDVLSRLLWGARVSLIVGFVATLVSLVIGVTYGATAAYVGGLVDSVMMRVVDILYSIPFLFVVIFLFTIIDNDEWKQTLRSYGITQISMFYIVLGAIYWLTMARVVRGQVLSLKHEQFVDAARTIGAGPGRIIFRHLIPNVLGIVIVYLTLTIPSVMLAEAFLSFLGLGVSPPDVSWGLMVNEGVQVITPLKIYWWMIVFPGLALSLTLFSLNFLGDGLRDALDPRLKNQ